MENNFKSRSLVIVCVLGPPGAGKGTLCKSAMADFARSPTGYQLYHLSVGDHLRHLCKSEPPDALKTLDIGKIRSSLAENKLLPADMLNQVLQHWLTSNLDAANPSPAVLLIDGFPRNMEQALAFEDMIAKPAKVIVLECPHDTAQDRYLARVREKADDKKRFEKRHGEYVETMKAISKHYEGITETIYAGGTPDDSYAKFVEALPLGEIMMKSFTSGGRLYYG
ncbi:P-loop containing nucleoside triphosphate hydrolase protein [Hypoxylon sp. FL1857]|nr:P-loop containing nucleoside triphosphate hydrolase protein [Hypoxylon sp. FL1857]